MCPPFQVSFSPAARSVLQIEQNAVNFDRSRRVRNDRILALPLAARRESHWKSLDDIPQRVRDECVEFVLTAASLEGKQPMVLGWGKVDDVSAVLTAAR
jgi:hypothetical protein